MPQFHKSALKWPGGKTRVLKKLMPLLNNKKALRLIEPFAGSAVVFLNIPSRDYVLSDISSDLINFFRQLRRHHHRFIQDACMLFSLNNEHDYYRLRKEFNHCEDAYRKALLFIYLNRHGYNGLWRVNNSGLCNVPYGRYRAPYFPRDEMLYMAFRLASAEIRCSHYLQVVSEAGSGDMIYADPPYLPGSETANFTAYHQSGFHWDDHVKLAESLVEANKRDAQVVISNSYTKSSLELYKDLGFSTRKIEVMRSISNNAASRKCANEIIGWIKNPQL